MPTTIVLTDNYGEVWTVVPH